MKKKKTGTLPIIISLMAVSFLYSECEDTIVYLFHPFSLRKIEMLQRSHPEKFYTLAALLIFALLTVVFFLRMVRMMGTPSARPAPARSAAPAAAWRSPAKHAEAEEAIHCAHLTGKAKYMEQIDNYLKTGLIDRSEYKVLRERYMKLDIPEEYH